MSIFAIIIRLLNALIMLAVPVFGALIFVKQTKIGWRLFGIGAVTFLAAQLFHIPFNIFCLSPFLEWAGLELSEGGISLVIVSLVLGLSAGVFEETARYLVYRYWLKKEQSWAEGTLLGLGHGGVESMLVGVLAFYALAQAFVLRGGNLGDYVSPEQIELAQTQLTAYWNMPWHTVILGAVERLAAMSFHVGASVIVLQVFKRDNAVWLWVAIAWHTLLDGVVVFGAQSLGIYATEAFVVLFGALSLWFAFLLCDKENGENSAESLLTPEISRVDFEVTSNELDDSRYG
ncbi:MAG: YhfC family glutamic-type intramembrane protease [Chloroflexota bacterium]|nr:YhfC family glutamic-type intramembrane protease [Chloroflexota bacterium]